MANVDTETLMEARIRGNLPEGFKSTLLDSKRLRELDNQSTADLTNTVEDYDDYTLEEIDVIRSQIQKVLSAFNTPERTIELPATGLEFQHLQKFAAFYKDDQDTPSGTIKDPMRADPDDIVFTFATPEVYEEVTGTNQSTFVSTGHVAGDRLELIDQDGLPDGGETADTTLSLDDNEMMYFTGDYVDLSEGQSIMTGIEWTTVDGESYGPDNGILTTRLSGAHLFMGQGAFVKSAADLDAKVYADGDAEIVPIAFYMGPGTNIPSLV